MQSVELHFSCYYMMYNTQFKMDDQDRGFRRGRGGRRRERGYKERSARVRTVAYAAGAELKICYPV